MTPSTAPSGARLTVAVVLAAGSGSRWQGVGHKLHALVDGVPIVEHAVRAAVRSGIGPVVVVTGAVALPEPVASIEGVDVVHNERWIEGQATSIAAGIAAADALGAGAVVVGLGDQPFVTPEAWSAVAAASGAIAIATYDGEPRNPVRLAREVWDLLPTTGDEGARVLARMRPELVEAVPCGGSPTDIDTVTDLQNAEERRPWQSRSSTNSP
jgi:molybdenum cofactor cytidylyltransferase